MVKPKAMVVAGVMSGTSADGVDVALVRVSPGVDDVPKVKVLGHEEFRYPKVVRDAVLRVAGGEAVSAAEIARLHWRLGEVYADAVEKTVARQGRKVTLIGLHGQTVYHQGKAEAYAGSKVRATWQIGEAAVVAERMRVPVVSDFRPGDLAAGGQGAPLVPMLDFCMFRSKTRNRVLLNLGGIANMTAIPAAGRMEDVIAFDSGPANMVIDTLMRRLYGREFDCGGQTAARGKAAAGVVDELMKDAYFALAGPKSCGREQFGAEFAERVRSLCAAAGAKKADVLATATELTARSIYAAYGRSCWTHLGVKAPMARGTDVVAAGGGVRNALLMRRLSVLFGELGVNVLTSDAAGVAVQAKEGAAFALLAWLSWHGLPGNVPSATGARRAVVLGKVTG